MKAIYRILYVATAVAILSSCGSGSEKSEYCGVYREASAGAIHPDSWLREMLEIQKNGLGLHRAESGYPYGTCLWAGVIPKGGNPIAKGWWPYEQSGYIVDGLYRCGIFLGDSTLTELGESNVRYVLDHPRADGMLGPDVLGDNQWALSVFARTLYAYYDKTGDDRVPQLLKNHFAALPDTLTNRQACIIEAMCKVYEYTGDTSVLAHAERIWDIFSMQGTADNEFFKYEDMAGAAPVTVHGVTAAEVGKQPVLLYLYTGDRKYLDAAEGFFSSVETRSELADGIPASYEQLHPKFPEALHETCDISDFLWSYGYMLMATGDVKWADKMETAMYNAALGAVSKDFKSLQYFSSPNQLAATHCSSIAPYGEEGAARQAYRPGFDTECCSGNVHRMFPNYVSRMWMRDNDGGIVAALYGPSSFSAETDGKKVTVRQITDYPFSGEIEFLFDMESPAKTAFTFRVPLWAEGATVSVNGGEAESIAAGTFHRIERKFRDGDKIVLSLPMEPRILKPYPDAVSVMRGPLLYTPVIEEDVKTVVDGFKTSEDFPAYDITPASPWNYALSADAEISVESRESGAYPWLPENTPVRLRVKAYRVPSWKMTGPSTPALPEPGFAVDDAAEEIVMIPSGCTRIRMTALPELTESGALHSADIPKVLFLGDEFPQEQSDEVEKCISESFSVLDICPGPEVKCVRVSGMAEAEKIFRGEDGYRIVLLRCSDVESHRRICRRMEKSAESRGIDILWLDRDGGFIAESGYDYADYDGFRSQLKKEDEKRCISYIAEASAQWWTGIASGNERILRVPLWDNADAIPDYLYEGPEYLNGRARIDRISEPELEVFLPMQTEKAPAVVFFPGGGLSYTGFLRNARELAELLGPRGVAVIGVKYRVKRGLETAAADAERAVRMVRAKAEEWNIDPDAIGVAGQSAGALIVLNLAAGWTDGDPDAADMVERESSKPDFVAPLTSWYYGKTECPFEYGKDTPPFFMRHAENDSGYGFALSVRDALLRAGVPLDWKTVPDGGHGAFEITEDGLGHGWYEELLEWMKTEGFVSRKP